ncbi:MAG: hypothetical protein U0165_12710 [Polyangiaceae bacterium]
MPEYVGPPRLFELSLLPLLAVLVPLFGWRILALIDARDGAPSRTALTVRAVLPPAITLALIVTMIRQVSNGAELISAALSLVSIGSMSLSIGLHVDRAASLISFFLVAASLALGAVLSTRDEQERAAVEIAQLHVALAEALLMAQGDGPLAVLAGALLGVIGVVVFGASTRLSSMVSWASAMTGGLAFVAWMGTIAWASVGTWVDGAIVPDIKPRFALVESRLDYRTARPRPVETVPRATGTGTLTMLAPPGATLLLDGLPFKATVPFSREPIAGGAHSLVIQTGDGVDDFEITAFRVDDGKDFRIDSTAGSLRFDALHEQSQIRPLTGSIPDGMKRIPELISALLAVLGLIASLVLPAFRRGTLSTGDVLRVLIVSSLPVVVCMRVFPFLSSASTLSGVVAIAAAMIGLFRAQLAATGRDPRGVLVDAASAQLALGVVAAASGASTLAVVSLIVAWSAVCAGCAVIERADTELGAHTKPVGEQLTRLATATSISLAAATPGAAAFWFAGGTAHAALNPAIWPTALGAVVMVLVVVLSAAQSFAVWRAHHLMVSVVASSSSSESGEGEKKSKKSRREKKSESESTSKKEEAQTTAVVSPSELVGRRVLMTLLGLAALISAEPVLTLVASKPVFWSWLAVAGVAREPPHAAKVGLMAIVVMMPAFLAWTRARVLYGPERASDWRAQEERRPMVKWLTSIAGVGLACALMVVPSTALAQTGPSLDVPTATIVLRPGRGAIEGSFVITNRTSSRIDVDLEPLTSDQDPRLPPGLTVSFDADAKKGEVMTSVDPGKPTPVYVRWDSTRARQIELHGSVIVSAGREKFFVQIEGERGAPLPWLPHHVLSLLIAIPLLGAIALLIAARVGERRDRTVRRLGIGLAIAEAVVGLVALWRFVPGVGRADGVEGWQLVETGSLGSLSTTFAVDGASFATVLILSFLPLMALLATPSAMPGMASAASLVFRLVGFAMIALTAQDVPWLVVGWSLLVLSLALGVRETIERQASLVLAASLLSVLCVAGFGVVVTGVSPELSRAGWSGAMSLAALVRHELLALAPVAGRPAVVIAWELLAVGLLLPSLMLAMPKIGARIVGAAPMPIASVALPLVSSVAMVVIVRWGVVLLPEATRWAALASAIVGVVLATLAAWLLVRARAFGDVAPALMLAQIGVALVGLGAVTSQGLGGVLLLAPAHLVSIVAVAVSTRVVANRVGQDQLDALGGLLIENRTLGVVFALSLMAAAGSPFLPAGWGYFSALYGALATQRWVVVAMVAVLVVVVMASLKVIANVVMGELPDAIRRSAALEPSGGKNSDIDGQRDMVDRDDSGRDAGAGCGAASVDGVDRAGGPRCRLVRGWAVRPKVSQFSLGFYPRFG